MKAERPEDEDDRQTGGDNVGQGSGGETCELDLRHEVTSWVRVIIPRWGGLSRFAVLPHHFK